MKRILFAILVLAMIAGCGGGQFAAGTPTETTYSTPWGTVTVTKSAFIFGSDYPASVVIPDIEGMRDTAFVVSMFSPCGVLAIDLLTSPLEVSKEFAGMSCPGGAGMFPYALDVASASRAFLITESHLIDFNPTTGDINTRVSLNDTLVLDSPLPISTPFDVNGDGTEETEVGAINMSDPGALLVSGNKLYVTMANFINYFIPAVSAPGVVRVFEIKDSAPYLVEAGKPLITTDYNPSGLTQLPNGNIAVTNSGMSNLSLEGLTEPTTNSSIDLLDPATDTFSGNISLGKAYLSTGKIAVTSDGKRGFVGSRTYGEAYEIDFVGNTAVGTHANPITITSNDASSDYISSLTLTYDDKYLFIASFDHSSIYVVDVSGASPVVNPELFPEPFVLGFPKGVSAENPTGVNTGVGSVAVRPGTAGLDFQGPDIYALTGTPGTMATIQTYAEEANAESNQ